MAISGDVFRINQVYELLQEGQWPTSFYVLPQEAGFFGGGSGPSSIVERIIFSTDTATASTRGPLSLSRSYTASTGNDNYGWFGGGSPGPRSTVDRIDFADDTGTASVRGPLSLARYTMAATGNDDYGWFGGGAPPTRSTVDRIDFADDTGTASVRGPLSSARYGLTATGNENNGWFGGGYAANQLAHLSIIDRITFANDSVTASVRAPLTSVRRSLAATGNENNGWFGGGVNPGATPSTILSRVDRINFIADLDSALTRGPLSIERWILTATSNDNFGWFGGGAHPAGSLSIIDRITFATDTATASVRGPLGISRNALSSTSGII